MRTLMAQQPNYAPYLGFFDRAARADVLVLQDDLNYAKQEWQNRNRVRSGDSWRWLTVPVHGSHRAPIRDTRPVDGSWLPRHLRVLRQEYPGSASGARIDALSEALGPIRDTTLAVINEALIRHLMDVLGIDTPIVRESELGIPRVLEPNRRLLLLSELLGCDSYLSGTGGRNYVQPELWRAEGVLLEEHLFAPLPYGDRREHWQPNLSALDLLLLSADPAAEFSRARQRSGRLPWTANRPDQVVIP